VLWLLPFGSALACRFGAVRFFLFMAVTAAAGAILGDRVVKANPFLAKMTAGDLAAWADRKMGGNAAPMSIAGPASSARRIQSCNRRHAGATAANSAGGLPDHRLWRELCAEPCCAHGNADTYEPFAAKA
jgi:hypothetical protein